MSHERTTMTLVTGFSHDLLVAEPPPRPYELGRVLPEQGRVLSAAELQIPDALAPAEIIKPVVIDGYVERLEARKPGRVADIQAMESEMAAYARSRREAGLWVNEPNTPYMDQNGAATRKHGWGDPRSKERFMGPGGILDDRGIVVWAGGAPHATSLLPLADPERVVMTVGRINGEVVAAEATDETRDWMTACTDGQEIRNRGAIMAEECRGVIVDYATKHPDEQMIMVSVAAGTLLPTIQAAINSGYDDRIRIVMLEKDPLAIEMAKQLVRDLGFRGELDVREVDVFDPKEMNAQLEELEGKAITTDGVGILEYANEEMRAKLERLKGPDYMLFNPAAFFRMIHRFTMPEHGATVVSQMDSGRPNGDFIRGVIGWPYIVECTPAQLMQKMVDGGASPKDVKLNRTSKDVYTMATVRKTEMGATRPWTTLDSAKAVGRTGLGITNGNGHNGTNGNGGHLPIKLRPPTPSEVTSGAVNSRSGRTERAAGSGRVTRVLRAAHAVLASFVF